MATVVATRERMSATVGLHEFYAYDHDIKALATS